MSPHRTDSMEDISSANGSTNGSAPAVQAPNGVVNGFHDSAVPELVDGPIAPQTSQETPATGHPRATKSKYLRPADPNTVYDLVCVGFGPASCAIAIALHDALESGRMTEAPKVLFLEKQTAFAWHAGMLLPGAKMQISFIKDLASLRDPRSHFTFLNYLHCNDRLIDFINLDTFTPARAEFEDYLRWCASHFDDLVQYGNEVLSVSPVQEAGPTKNFEVTARNTKSGATTLYQTKNVVLAVGGQAAIPKPFPANNARVIHSSQYAQRVPSLLSDQSAPVRVAVVGAGQSSAEIFNNVQELYPNSETYMIMRSEWLKPSDDSPFVNSIFNPEFIDTIWPRSTSYRANLLEDARATNYGVVRLELIEHLYQKMYHQKRTLGFDERKWPHRIMPGTKLVSVEEKADGLRLTVAPVAAEEEFQDGPSREEVLDVDVVICATGYQRTAHIDMLKDSWSLLPEVESGLPSTKGRWTVETPGSGKGAFPSTRVLEVGRNYGVRFSPEAVTPGSGIWLQGCCEATHGLSDTLLSVLSTRSGEMVKSIFG
ncbi:hypothetical protein OQA88_2476 [Cercophora sp. LCS_1]